VVSRQKFCKLFLLHKKDSQLLPDLFVCFLCNPPPPKWARVSSCTRFLDHTQRSATYGRTPLEESSQIPLPDNTQHSQQTDIHAPGGIRIHKISRRAAADLRLRPRGHWDRRAPRFINLYLTKLFEDDEGSRLKN